MILCGFLFITFICVSTPILCERQIVQSNIAVAYTPLTENQDLNLKVIPQYAKYYAENNIYGVFVAGSAGEGTSLSYSEHKDLFLAWVTEAKKYDLEIIAQIGGLPSKDVLDLAKYCEEIGVNIIAVLPELYRKPNTIEKAVLDLKGVSDAAPSMPIMFYASPFTQTIVDNEPAQFYGLAKQLIPKFCGIKASIDMALKITANYPECADEIFIYNSVSALPAYVSGGGTINIAPNLFPNLVNAIQEAVANNNIPAAANAQARLNALMTSINLGPKLVHFTKAAMEIITGLPMGPPRPPLIKPSYDQLRKITKNLEQLGVKLSSPVY